MPPIKHDANKDIFRGQLFIFIKGEPIAYGKDASLSITTEEVDISNKMMSGGWKAALPGNSGFSINSESLLTQVDGQVSFDTLLDCMIKKETVDFIIGEAKVTEETTTGGKFEIDKSKKFYEGVAMITSLDLKSTDGDIASCSTGLTGVGALAPGTIVP